MRKINKKAAAVALGAVALTGTGVAYAYWTTTGSGSGTASTNAGNATAFSVTGNVPNAMYPGDTAQTITATVKNEDLAVTYYLTALKAYVTTNEQGCTGADFLLNGAAAPSTSAAAADLGIAAGDLAAQATRSKTFTIKFNNLGSPQDACKGATVTVNYVAS